MKTLLRIVVIGILLLNCVALFAQPVKRGGGIAQSKDEKTSLDFYHSVDVWNLIYGGKKLSDGTQRNPAGSVDWKGGFTITDGRLRAGGFLEWFPTIDYFAMGLEAGSPLRIDNAFDFVFESWETDIVITPGVTGQWVWRDGLPEDTYGENVTVYEYFVWGLFLELQFDEIFGDSRWYFAIQGDLLYRSDKYGIWGRGVDPSGTLPALWANRSLYFEIGFEILGSD